MAAAGEPGAPFEPPTCVGEGPMAMGASGLVRAVGRPVRGSVAAARFSCEAAANCCTACGGVRSESESVEAASRERNGGPEKRGEERRYGDTDIRIISGSERVKYYS